MLSPWDPAQVLIKPHAVEALNRLEFLSLLCTLFTCLSGIFFGVPGGEFALALLCRILLAIFRCTKSHPNQLTPFVTPLCRSPEDSRADPRGRGRCVQLCAGESGRDAIVACSPATKLVAMTSLLGT